MKKGDKIVLLTSVNFLRSYSGFQYLADSLSTEGYLVEVFAQIPTDQICECSQLNYQVTSCYTGVFGQIPKARHLLFTARIIYSLFSADALILNSTRPSLLMRIAVNFKKKKGSVFINYCPELWNPNKENKHSKVNNQYYLTHSKKADLTIDVDPTRAARRKDWFKLPKEIVILPNTLPMRHLPPSKDKEPDSGDRIVIVYTGIYSDSTLNELSELLYNFRSERKLTLHWYAHSREIPHKKNFDIKSSRLEIKSAIPRNQLIQALSSADIGLITYAFSKTKNPNLEYAAPSKLYEYMSMGLPILSYPNPSIKHLVNKYKIGICSEEDTPASLALALEKLIQKNALNSISVHAKKVFESELCYEHYIETLLDKIRTL